MLQNLQILGAGVIGLTTALELSLRCNPLKHKIQILATHLPGDRSISYTSPWAGANWLSVATDNDRQENWDRVTYKKFLELSENEGIGKESGVNRMPIWAFYDSVKEEAGVLSKETGRVWYEELAGVRWLGEKEMNVEGREGVKFGYEAKSFVVNVQVYLPWLVSLFLLKIGGKADEKDRLQNEVLKRGVEMVRTTVTDIRELTNDANVKAVFNCTGLGSYTLKGVEDKSLYPTRVRPLPPPSPFPSNTLLTDCFTRAK